MKITIMSLAMAYLLLSAASLAVDAAQNPWKKGDWQVPSAQYDDFQQATMADYERSKRAIELRNFDAKTSQFLNSEAVWQKLGPKLADVKKLLKKMPAGLGLQTPMNGDYNFLHLSGESSADVIDYLVKQGADVNQRDFMGKTPIFYATKAEVFLRLLEHGATLDITDEQGQSPLFYFPAEVLQALNLAAKAGTAYNFKVNAANKLGRTPLFYANLAEAKVLASLGADFEVQDVDGKTVLFGKADPELIKYLVTQGVHLNKKDNAGKTALFYTRDEKSLNTLLQQGASLQVVDAKGIPITFYLLKEKISAEHHVKTELILDLLKTIRAEKHSLNYVDEQQNTLLHLFNCEQGNAEILQQLASFDIDVNHKNAQGNTALIEQLIRYRFDDYAQTDNCLLPLITAATDLSVKVGRESKSSANKPLVSMLGNYPKLLMAAAKLSADLNVQDDDTLPLAFDVVSSYSHYTRPMTPAEYEDLSIRGISTNLFTGDPQGVLSHYEQLLQLPALDLNITSTDGKAAWSSMVNQCDSYERYDGWLARLRFVIAGKIELNTTDNAGQSALHYAAQNNCRRTYDALIAQGIQQDIRDTQGKLARQYFP